MTLRKGFTACALLLLCLSAHAEESLFFRMGGEAKLKAAVDELVVVMLADQRINFVFAQTDLTRFKFRLYTQLCELAIEIGFAGLLHRQQLGELGDLSIQAIESRILASDLLL